MNPDFKDADTETDGSSPGTTQRRLGIFGGTFDPIHTGHLIIASEAMRQFGLDQIVFVPAGRPPHKPDQLLSPNNDRRRMIELAIDHRPAFSISDIDLQRPGPSYSADLVDQLSAEYAGAELFFIIGADSLRDFHTWHQPHRIVEQTVLLVAPRPGVSIDLQRAIAMTPALESRVEMIEMPLIEISSTAIRDRASGNVSFWYQVPIGVERYIEEHGLYSNTAE